MTRRKTPPYLAQAAELYRNNRKPDNSIFIHLGKGAWKHAKAQQDSGNCHTCLNADDEPDAYHWPVLKNDAVVRLWSEVEGAQIMSLVKALLRDGADLVLVMQPDYLSSSFRPGDL